MLKAERVDGLWVWFETLQILGSIQIRSHDEAGSGARGANEIEHLLVAVERLGGPVLGDFREQTVLDRIPFRGAGRIMDDGGGHAKCVAQLGLDFGLPSPGTATVTATRVGQNEDFRNPAIATRSFAFSTT